MRKFNIHHFWGHVKDAAFMTTMLVGGYALSVGLGVAMVEHEHRQGRNVLEAAGPVSTVTEVDGCKLVRVIDTATAEPTGIKVVYMTVKDEARKTPCPLVTATP